ncbi:MAG TPA: hypothetical protein VEG44_00030 [Candidatus Acidoferrales bacterium]|nr:hypothetical protein [Candidatus Acidoferrales bacterium]
MPRFIGGPLQFIGVPLGDCCGDAAMVCPTVEETRISELLGGIHRRGVDPAPILRLKGKDGERMKVANRIRVRPAIDCRAER